MDPLVIWLIVAAAIVAVGWAVANHNERKRQAAIAAAAAELHLAHNATLPTSDRVQLDAFKIAQQGHSRAATSATVADSGELRLVVFDFTYTVGSGKSKQTRYYKLVMATSLGLNLPQFSLIPETIWHRLGDFVGIKDIDVDHDPQFSKKFYLTGQRESAIREFFNAQRRAALCGLGALQVEAQGNCFIVYQPGKQRHAQDLRQLLELGFQLYSLFRNQAIPQESGESA